MTTFLRTALTIATLTVATTLGTAGAALAHPGPPGGAPECATPPSMGNQSFGYDGYPTPSQPACPTHQPPKPPVHPGPTSLPCPTTPPETPAPPPPATTTPATTTAATTTSSTTPVVPAGNATPTQLANTGFGNAFLGWAGVLLLFAGGGLLVLYRSRRKA